jgi:hypothetical protein
MRANGLSNVDVMFFLAQARNASVLAEWTPIIEVCMLARRRLLCYMLAGIPKALLMAPTASQKEVDENNDIVVIRGADMYYNFVNKTLRMLQFAHADPVGYTHVLKTDDDTWVRPAEIMSMVTVDLSDNTSRLLGRSIYAGCFVDFKPIRDPYSKWYMSEDDLPDSALPSDGAPTIYAAGWGYILSADLIEKIVATVDGYSQNPSTEPTWYRGMNGSCEDIVIGILLRNETKTSKCDVFQDPDWRHKWSPSIAVRHMKSDSPEKLTTLAQEEIKS